MLDEKEPEAVPSRLPPSLIAVFAISTAKQCVGGSLYGSCNTTLRSTVSSKCTPFVLCIWLLMHAEAKCERYGGVNVFRGVKGDMSAAYHKDREETWFQFSSYTCDIAVDQSEQFLGKTATRTLFSIELTSGRARITTYCPSCPARPRRSTPHSRLKVRGQLDACNGIINVQLRGLASVCPIIDFDSLLLVPASVHAAPAPPLKPLTLSSGKAPRQQLMCCCLMTSGVIPLHTFVAVQR